VGTLRGLRTVILRGNRFRVLPPELAGLRHLTSLDLQDNPDLETQKVGRGKGMT
jgi:Leucine-rich repeat (LRR) protein